MRLFASRPHVLAPTFISASISSEEDVVASKYPLATTGAECKFESDPSPVQHIRQKKKKVSSGGGVEDAHIFALPPKLITACPSPDISNATLSEGNASKTLLPACHHRRQERQKISFSPHVGGKRLLKDCRLPLTETKRAGKPVLRSLQYSRASS
jgi:hypothetical protein